MLARPGPGYWVSAYQSLSISYNGSQISVIRTQSSVPVMFVSSVYRDKSRII